LKGYLGTSETVVLKAQESRNEKENGVKKKCWNLKRKKGARHRIGVGGGAPNQLEPVETGGCAGSKGSVDDKNKESLHGGRIEKTKENTKCSCPRGFLQKGGGTAERGRTWDKRE